MNTLAVNCGSSSIKVSLFDEKLQRIYDLNLKGLHSDKTTLEILFANDKQTLASSAKDVTEGLKCIFQVMKEQLNFSFTSLKGIGHRFVHGGENYSSVRVDQKILLELEKLSELAPLHNAACLAGIEACLHLAAAVPQVVVFDTAFHRSLPSIAAKYAIPDMQEKYPIKRYGFHGISNAFIWEVYKKHKQTENAKVITLHLGSGCSATAIVNGQSIDTSMGFTPAEGLIMATRAGDIDVAVMEFICQHHKKTPSEVIDILNSQSGLLGISGISSNIQDLIAIYDKNEKAKLAVDMFCYRIVKYLGAYIAALEGVNAVIFSGGIGENASLIRELIVKKMVWYGLKLDPLANQKAVGLLPGKIQEIHLSDSSTSIYVIATDENHFIAQNTLKLH